MALPAFILKQLEDPSGLLGRFILWRLNSTNRAMNCLALEALPVAGGDRVLEVGFGGGALIDMILKHEPQHVAGTELSDLALARAESRFNDPIASGKLVLERADAARIPFADGAFTNIYCSNVIYFLADRPAVFAELYRVLDQQGALAICYQQQGPDGTTRYAPADIERELQQSGFSSVRSRESHDKMNGSFFCTVVKR